MGTKKPAIEASVQTDDADYVVEVHVVREKLIVQKEQVFKEVCVRVSCRMCQNLSVCTHYICVCMCLYSRLMMVMLWLRCIWLERS